MVNENASLKRMLPKAYDEMKGRLTDLLKKFGMWSRAEMSEVAEFVEKEVCLDRAFQAATRTTLARPLLNEAEAMFVIESSKLPPEIWLHALRSTFTDKRLIEGFMRYPAMLRTYESVVERASEK
jgi:hypothetical protein